MKSPHEKFLRTPLVVSIGFFLHEAATRFSSRLSTHLMTIFTDSLHG